MDVLEVISIISESGGHITSLNTKTNEIRYVNINGVDVSSTIYNFALNTDENDESCT